MCSALSRFRAIRERLTLPGLALDELRRDRLGLRPDPGLTRAVDEAIAWLVRAQDESASRDGGVARHFSVVSGWSSSYPETTGYIIPTMLTCAHRLDRPDLRERARRMLDWLVSIQLPGGGFQGGLVDSKPVLPVTFNTGQILLGLASGVGEFGEAYREPLRRAADWLVETQDADGCWRRHASRFVMPGDKAYYAHAAWGLLEAARVEPDRDYTTAALANIRWTLSLHHPDGWFDQCCLNDPTQPLTHTLGYALRGVLEAYRTTRDPAFLDAGRATADALVRCIGPDGFLPGQIAPGWRGNTSWACLTGSVQLAACWFLLFRWTQDEAYRDEAYAVNRFVRRTVRFDGAAGTRGGIAGSFPIDGGYGRFEFLNWAAKFFIDAQFLEADIRSGTAGPES